MELNREQIVKEWLEICAEDTPYPDQRQALNDALALITSQEQRIKELTEEIERLRNRVTFQVVLDDEKVEEIKNKCLERVELDIKAIQADTVRKMHDMLENRIKGNLAYHGWYLKETVIPKIAKELLEEKDED